MLIVTRAGRSTSNLKVHGLVSTPSYHTLEGIVADSYPYMFKESDTERRERGLER